MGAARVSRVTRARLGFFVGTAMAAVGLGMMLGLGWGLVAGGAGIMFAFVLLYDVGEPVEEEPVVADGVPRFRKVPGGDW